MKTLKIATACATLALALSACGSSTEAAKTEEPSASATETSTSKSFTVSSSSAAASESAKASASPTASASASASSASASASASQEAPSGSVSLPADMTISADKAASTRPDRIAQFEKDGAPLEDTSSSKGSQKYRYRGDNPYNYTDILVMYLPESDYNARVSALKDTYEMGNGVCGLEHESDNMRTEQCYFPVADGGVLLLDGTVDKTRTDGVEIDTQRIHDFAAEFVNQVKN